MLVRLNHRFVTFVSEGAEGFNGSLAGFIILLSSTMWSWIVGSGSAEASAEEKQESTANTGPPFILLVIGGTTKDNWYECFRGCDIRGRPIQVEMAAWKDIEVTSFSDGGTTVAIRGDLSKAIPNTSMCSTSRTVIPDLCLIRSACFGIEGMDWRNQFIGLMCGNVPSINSFDSLYTCLNKPLIYAKLLSVQHRVGKEAFPLIAQTYYSSWKAMNFSCGYPMVRERIFSSLQLLMCLFWDE